VQGDPWQLGGTFVIQPGGRLTFAHRSEVAGDHAQPKAVLAALDADAPTQREREEIPAGRRVLGEVLSRAVDPFIVGSFDRLGFRIHALTFEPDALDVDLGGRRCLVTGANSGIGRATAEALADLGAEVVLLCRSEERGLAAAEAIRERTGNSAVHLEQVDMSDLDSVRAAGERLAEQPVDVLVHNAGVLPDERALSPQGIEQTFATHCVGPFLLTRLLEERLAASPDGRLIWVSSGGMYTRGLEVDDPSWSQREYDGVLAYAETKRAQVVLAELWAERLASKGVVVTSMHPGWADTPAVASSLPTFHRVTEAILRTPEEGADTVIWLAASERDRIETGRFYFDRRARRTHLLPWTRERSDERERLWRLCEALSQEVPGGDGAAPAP
jgi:NAD(P)-dependent dehydrogenase (short-subunit alcohol dehydrogenase family)